MSELNRKRDFTSSDVDMFMSQFRGKAKWIMTGQLLFMTILYREIRTALEPENVPEKHKETVDAAAKIARETSEKYFDEVSELYEGEHTELSVDVEGGYDLIFRGYVDALTQYTNTTHNILKTKTFKGKENVHAQVFFTAVGLGLADALEDMMSNGIVL